MGERSVGPQKAYERQMAAFNERRRRQKEEKDKLGILALEARGDWLSDRMYEIENTIDEAPVSPTKAAAMFVVVMLIFGHKDDTLSQRDEIGLFARNILPLIRPHLSGLIAQHIDDLIDHPDTPNHQRFMLPFWGG